MPTRRSSPGRMSKKRDTMLVREKCRMEICRASIVLISIGLKQNSTGLRKASPVILIVLIRTQYLLSYIAPSFNMLFDAHNRPVVALSGAALGFGENSTGAVAKHYTSPKIQQMLKSRRGFCTSRETFQKLRNGPEFARYLWLRPHHNRHDP